MGLTAISAEMGAPFIQARATPRPPKIDGVLEEVWFKADSVFAFTQQQPDNGKPASEPTTVYLLYDAHHLFVAFRCEVADLTRVHDRLSEEPDGVRLLLDTFDDNTTCYCFIVGFNGVESDYRITADGAMIENWDGVWWSEVKRHPWGYGIEIVIPFKTLRYLDGKTEWGIDFGRDIVARGELSFWSTQEVTGYRVSRMGRLTGIQPGHRGRQIEFYPVGLVRYEKAGAGSWGWKQGIEAHLGLDAACYPSSSGNLQLTLLPDFAQIEADPYQVNLSRYELWLAERRPFFVEAVETFGGSSQPVKMFYSRRIGKPLASGSVVPILAGLKWTDRFPHGQYGMLAAYTGECDAEPKSIYSVLTIRRQCLGNSELGLLYAGKDNPSLSNHGLGLDGIFRSRRLNSRLFVAGSQYGDSFDYALSLDGAYQSQTFTAALVFREIQPRFNMNGPGYTTWRGQYLTFYAGPAVSNRPPVQFGSFYPGLEIQREWDYPQREISWRVFLNTALRILIQHSLGLWAGFGKDWALATSFHSGYIGGFFASDFTKPFSFNLWLNYYHPSANYRRGIIAPVAQSELSVQQRIGDRWSVALETGTTIEPDSRAKIDWKRDVTVLLRPGMEFRFTAKSAIRFSSETILGYDLVQEKTYTTNSLFALYSWTFSPRSTFYLAANCLSNTSGIKLITVAKLRYLLNL